MEEISHPFVDDSLVVLVIYNPETENQGSQYHFNGNKFNIYPKRVFRCRYANLDMSNSLHI